MKITIDNENVTINQLDYLIWTYLENVALAYKHGNYKEMISMMECIKSVLATNEEFEKISIDECMKYAEKRNKNDGKTNL